MKKHPYIGLPDRQFWKNEKGIREPSLFDPVGKVSFTIGKDEPVVTAGSCFAQHVSRYLKEYGFNFHVAEHPHPMVAPKLAQKFNYGLFSARYGNIYTARQLRQLIERAYGLFIPVEDIWLDSTGRPVDSFRPQIHPGGFISVAELHQDRKVHLHAVRNAVENMAVFVFTLGLTEAWIDKRDGAVFPLAPGVAGGKWDPGQFQFHNFDVREVAEDMQWSVDFIRQINPAVRIIITVSPVPLNATALDRHVFVSTTYSKSVLRIAAEVLCKANSKCDYFPSYEIITSPYARGAYFGPDCREIAADGVSHVMSLFLKHYGNIDASARHAKTPEKDVASEVQDLHFKKMEANIEILCDEEAINNR